jgi:hypothetical protein
LVELLVVIGIIAMLISVLLPVLAGARTAAKKTICAANLHQNAQAFIMYAGENKGVFPETNTKTYSWLGGYYWVMPNAQEFVGRYFRGNFRTLYCPALLEEAGRYPGAQPEADWWWNTFYQRSYPSGGGFRITGYEAMTHRGLPDKYRVERLSEKGRKLLFVDLNNTIFGQWSDPANSWGLAHRGKGAGINKPAGRYAAYHDGSVEWVNFSDMKPRYDLNSGGRYIWWW